MLDVDTFRKELRERIHGLVDISDKALDLMLTLVKSGYYTEGAALYAISDCLDRMEEKGLL